MLVSHLGRPKDREPELSMRPVEGLDLLEEAGGEAGDWLDVVPNPEDGDLPEHVEGDRPACLAYDGDSAQAAQVTT